jgi:hypothetical protein
MKNNLEIEFEAMIKLIEYGFEGVVEIIYDIKTIEKDGR